MHASNERIDRQAAKQFELLRNLLKSSIRGLGNTFEFNLTTTSIRVIFLIVASSFASYSEDRVKSRTKIADYVNETRSGNLHGSSRRP